MEQATPDEYPEDFPATFAIDEISLFSYGRAGAWIYADCGFAYLTFVFDPETGRWLIDAWDDRDPNKAAGATPAAYVVRALHAGAELSVMPKRRD